jgi:methionyl-tRNA synthetase
VREAYVTEMSSYALEGGSNVAIQACRDVNGYLTREEPWKLVGDEYAERRRSIVRATLEAVYAVAHLLLPFIPRGASEIFRKMNTPPRSLWDIDPELRGNLAVGTKIDVGSLLYEINKSEEEKELSKAEASNKKKLSYEEAQRLKKEKKAQESAARKAALQGEAAGDDQPEFTKIDIRVGQITKVRFKGWTKLPHSRYTNSIIRIPLFRFGTTPMRTSSSARKSMSASRMDRAR